MTIFNLQFAYRACSIADILLNSLTPEDFLKENPTHFWRFWTLLAWI